MPLRRSSPISPSLNRLPSSLVSFTHHVAAEAPQLSLTLQLPHALARFIASQSPPAMASMASMALVPAAAASSSSQVALAARPSQASRSLACRAVSKDEDLMDMSNTWYQSGAGAQARGALLLPASRCIQQPILPKARRARVCIVAASSNEGGETEESSAPSTSGSGTEEAKPAISEKRAQAEAEVKKGQTTAIVTGAISVLLGVGYLVLIQLLDTRGVNLVPPPPEAFNP